MNAKEMIDVNITRMIGQLRSMATALEGVPALLEHVSFAEVPNDPTFTPLHPSTRWLLVDLRDILQTRTEWKTEQVLQAMNDVVALRMPDKHSAAVRGMLGRREEKGK